MKMRWEEPRIEVQKFIPNEYVAACYYGNCNISGEVFMDTNHNGQYDVEGDEYKYTNDACGHVYDRCQRSPISGLEFLGSSAVYA